MSLKLSLLVFAIFGLLQVGLPVPTSDASLATSNEAISKIASDLQKLAEDLSEKLEMTSAHIDAAMSEADAKMTSNIALLEKEWGKRVDKTADKYEACSEKVNRLNELSSEVVTATKQCAAQHRQKMLDVQLASRLQSTLLKYSANKLAGIAVDCVEVNEHLPLCVVTTQPLSALANLLREGGETVGKGATRAETYEVQLSSCWKQSSMEAASLAQEIIRDIAQCTKAQS